MTYLLVGAQSLECSVDSAPDEKLQCRGVRL